MPRLNHPRCLLPQAPIPPCLSRSCLMLRACSQLAHGVPGTHIRLSASGGPPLSPPCSQGHSCPYPSSRTPSSTLAKHSNPRRCASPRRSAVSGSGPHCGTGKSPRWPNFSEQPRTRGMGTTLLLHCKKHCSPCCWVPLPPPRWNAWLTAYDVPLPPQHVWPTQQALKPQTPLPEFTRATTRLPALNRKQQPPLPRLGRRFSRHLQTRAQPSPRAVPGRR